jgi:hypothetical protein
MHFLLASSLIHLLAMHFHFMPPTFMDKHEVATVVISILRMGKVRTERLNHLPRHTAGK